MFGFFFAKRFVGICDERRVIGAKIRMLAAMTSAAHPFGGAASGGSARTYDGRADGPRPPPSTVAVKATSGTTLS